MKWVIKSGILIFLLIVGLVSILIVGCAPQKNFHALSFFFDGVPDPEMKTDSASATTSVDTLAIIASVVKPDMFMHKPYEEEKCKNCHEEGYSNSLLKPLPDLCYICHQDFSIKYRKLHGPVASGNCLACHDQHMAKYDKLLTRTDKQLCIYCHNSKMVYENKIHKNIGNKNCTECHNPHGGENKGMINTGSCYKCHDDFNTKYAYLHGPVASGNCSACHDSHDSKSENLLLASSVKLCLNCHNSDLVYKSAVHKKNKKSNCTECHNPHGGNDRFVLLQAMAVPGKPLPATKSIQDTLTTK